MTAKTYSSSMANTNDADFRAWTDELINGTNGLIAAGIGVSGDTGQINTATATRPASNTSGGFVMLYLNDSLHATKPIYIKLEMGSNSNQSCMALWVTVGSGTNGSGTITGTIFSRTLISQSGIPNAGNYPTFICVNAGYLGLAFKRRGVGSSSGTAFLAVCRSIDAAGDPNAAAVYVYYSGSANYLTRTTYISSEQSDGYNHAFFPGNATTTMVGADAQAVRHFGYQPTIRCIPFLLSYLDAEVGNESTFAVTPIGVTARTYLALGGTGTPANASVNSSSTHKLAMQFD